MKVCQKREVNQKEQKEGQRAGQFIQPKKVRIDVPSDTPIKRDLNRMMSTEKEGLQKLFNTAHYIAKKRTPYTDFENLVNLQVLNGAEFNLSWYVNKKGCRSFIQNIADYLFDDEITKKLRKVNFTVLLHNGSTNKGVVEQEVIFITFMNPDTCSLVMKYFNVVACTS